jgi:hypothetical protein
VSGSSGPDEPAESAAPVEPAEHPVPRETPEGAASPRERRPLIERIGLAAIALLLAILFGGVAAAAWIGGEPFLTAMSGIGCLMTVWVGALTLIRG